MNSCLEKPADKPRGFFQKFKWLIITLLGLIIAAGILIPIVFFVIIPNFRHGTNRTNGSNGANGDNLGGVFINDPIAKLQPRDSQGLISQPDLSKTDWKEQFGPFDDAAQPNDYAPPLNEPFPYRNKKVRGVNLGGWLVPEPFIVPSMYKPYDETADVKDEWGLCSYLGKEECTKRLTKHYATWVTEAEIKTLAEAGLNHVRIPFAYWSLDNNDEEPFVYGAWEYLLRGIQWCRKYGLRVMIDFHAAPGSQNGWNHSGRLGQVRFLNASETTNQQNIDRFLAILEKAVKFFDQPEWRNVVTQIGLVNEPAIQSTHNKDMVFNFYQTAYKLLQKISVSKPLLVIHDGFVGLEHWGDVYNNVKHDGLVLDTHSYIIFDKDLIVKPKEEINDYPCAVWKEQIKNSTQNFGPTMCGEFSLASNDCGPWLNGIGMGIRYEGTFDGNPPVCPTCTCKDADDYTKFTADHKSFLLKFAEKQMDAFESGIGWFFWNFKTENHVNPHWDYLIGLEEGWIPKDAGKRSNSCSD